MANVLLLRASVSVVLWPVVLVACVHARMCKFVLMFQDLNCTEHFCFRNYDSLSKEP